MVMIVALVGIISDGDGTIISDGDDSGVGGNHF